MSNTTTVKKVTVEAENGSFYVCVDGERWMRSSNLNKAEELAEAFCLAADDDEVQFIR